MSYGAELLKLFQASCKPVTSNDDAHMHTPQIVVTFICLKNMTQINV